MAEIFPEEPLTSLPDAVAAMGALPVPVGPVPRTLDTVEDELTGVSLSLYEEELLTERLRWALASAKRGRARLRAQVAALLEERRSTNEALDDAVQELRARQSCPCPPADQPGPHQLGCPQAEVPVTGSSMAESADRLTAFFAPVAALREALSREEPHDSPLHQAHRLGHDLELPSGADPGDRLLGGDELRRALRGHLFGGGA